MADSKNRAGSNSAGSDARSEAVPENRRSFLSRGARAGLAAGLAAGLVPAVVSAGTTRAPRDAAPGNALVAVADDAPRSLAPLYKISLAQWSLHKTLFAGKLDHLDFAKTASSLGIDGVEYVNQFFKDKAKDKKYLFEMKDRARSEGVQSLLIMIDGEGAIGDPDDKKRTQAVENHYRWVEAASFLGCHSIRVNASSSGSYDEQIKLAADGLRRLAEFADAFGLNVIVENHGGLSSNGAWLAKVMKTAEHPRCGTLPDFGNFRVSGDEWYDRYKGVDELMPYAKAVSAKSHEFDADGNETKTDYRRMMEIVHRHGYRGYVGIEWEGGKPGEIEGILLTRKLLERVRSEIG